MAKRKPGYWKQYYADHREQRIKESVEYQKEHREQRRGYQREYQREYAKRPEVRAKIHERRRKKYATDAVYREKVKQAVKDGRKRNPLTRLAARLAKFGLTVEDYDAKLAEQDGGCAICGVKRGDAMRQRLAIDHCHDTGVFRGLLCTNCNQGLGKFKDDIERFERAILYLRASQR